MPSYTGEPFWDFFCVHFRPGQALRLIDINAAELVNSSAADRRGYVPLLSGLLASFSGSHQCNGRDMRLHQDAHIEETVAVLRLLLKHE